MTLLEINPAAKKLEWSEDLTTPEEVLAAIEEGAYVCFFIKNPDGFDSLYDSLSASQTYEAEKIQKWLNKGYMVRRNLLKKVVVQQTILLKNGTASFVTVIRAVSCAKLRAKLAGHGENVKEKLSQLQWFVLNNDVLVSGL